MESLWLLLKTSRPLGWVIAPLVFLIGLQFSGAELSLLAISQMLLLSFPFSVFLYGVNDIYDYRSDRINPRKRLMEGIRLDPKHHSSVKNAAFIVVPVLILDSLVTLNPSNVSGMLLLVFFSYFYSAPPLRFKEKPPWDSFSNGAMFFSTFLLGYSFGGTLSQIPIKIYLVAFCVMGIHSYSTIMDYSADKKAGNKTLAAAFGRRKASLFALVIFIVTLVFAEIRTRVINYYLIFCGIIFLITFFLPSEKLASTLFKLIFVGFIVTAIVFLL